MAGGGESMMTAIFCREMSRTRTRAKESNVRQYSRSVEAAVTSQSWQEPAGPHERTLNAPEDLVMVCLEVARVVAMAVLVPSIVVVAVAKPIRCPTIPLWLFSGVRLVLFLVGWNCRSVCADCRVRD